MILPGRRRLKSSAFRLKVCLQVDFHGASRPLVAKPLMKTPILVLGTTLANDSVTPLDYQDLDPNVPLN